MSDISWEMVEDEGPDQTLRVIRYGGWGILESLTQNGSCRESLSGLTSRKACLWVWPKLVGRHDSLKDLSLLSWQEDMEARKGQREREE